MSGAPDAFRATSRCDHRARDGALQVVRDEQRTGAAPERADPRHHRLFDRPVGLAVVLVVDARHLLVALGDDAHLLGRRPPGILDEPVERRARGRQFSAQPVGRGVRSDHADERHAAAERQDVVRDVGGAAQPHVLRPEAHDRHRRLGRNARHVPDDEAVEHHVADDEHGESGEPRDEVAAAPGVDRRERHAAGRGDAARAAAKGSVTSTRNSIRNSESPKLYSNMPAASIAITAASADAAMKRDDPVAEPPHQIGRERDDEPEPDGERRQAALGGDLHRHVVQVRVDGLDRLGHAVLRGTDARPCSGRRRPADGRGPCARPRAASRPGRGWSDP